MRPVEYHLYKLSGLLTEGLTAISSKAKVMKTRYTEQFNSAKMQVEVKRITFIFLSGLCCWHVMCHVRVKIVNNALKLRHAINDGSFFSSWLKGLKVVTNKN